MYFAIGIFSKQELQRIKRREVSVIFHNEFVLVVQCYSIKYFVSKAKLLTSGDIELNPGPVTQGNNPNHLIYLKRPCKSRIRR